MDKFDGIDIIKDDLYEDSQEGDAEWLQTKFEIKELLGLSALPDLQGILFAIGLQELGQIRDEFTKEERVLNKERTSPFPLKTTSSINMRISVRIEAPSVSVT